MQWYLRSFDPNFYMTGFWDLGIPTLEDNNQLVTPPFHFLVSRVLSRPQDFHTRNWAWTTKASPRLLAALGTRHILADRPLSDSLPNLRLVQTNGEGKRVGLNEIPVPNVGNYSPTTMVLSSDATKALSLMASGELSFSETAVVHDAELSGLVRANADGFFYERGGVRVRATSLGTSLLVLQIQFSNSLRVAAAESGAGAPIRLIRVNLLETGVLFTGTINVKIAHVFGLFRDVKGRLREIEDYMRSGTGRRGSSPTPRATIPWVAAAALRRNVREN